MWKVKGEENHCGTPTGISLPKNQRCPRSSASTRCHWCFSQKQRTLCPARWKKKSAPLVQSSVKYQKVSKQPCFKWPRSFCVKKCNWTFPIYKVHCTLLTLPVYAWPLSLPAIFCSWCFEMGPVRKGESLKQAVLMLLTSSSPFRTWFHSPSCTVWMAELANSIGICILPDEGVILTQHPCGAGLHTVGTIYKMGTLHTVVWALQRRKETTHLRFPYAPPGRNAEHKICAFNCGTSSAFSITLLPEILTSL